VRPSESYTGVFSYRWKKDIAVSEENKIKVNDLPDEKTQEEVELPVINEDNNRGGHSEGGCCGAWGG